MTPRGMIPEGMTPEEMTLEGMTLEGMTLEGMIPEGMIPEGMIPEGMTPEGMTLGRMTTRGMCPGIETHIKVNQAEMMHREMKKERATLKGGRAEIGKGVNRQDLVQRRGSKGRRAVRLVQWME